MRVLDDFVPLGVSPWTGRESEQTVWGRRLSFQTQKESKPFAGETGIQSEYYSTTPTWAHTAPREAAVWLVKTRSSQNNCMKPKSKNGIPTAPPPLPTKTKSKKSADPLPPVPASCRGDRRGMQLEVIGINDGPWKTRPNARKVDFQDRSRDRSRDRSWNQSWDFGCFRLLVVS